MRRSRWLVTAICVWVMAAAVSAQDSSSPHIPLESITAQNASRVVRLWGEGIGYGGGVAWSSDGQAVYFESIDGVWEYRLDDVEHPHRLDQLPFPEPQLHYYIPDPVATSRDGRYAVHQNVQADDERSAIYEVENTSTGNVIRRIPGDATVMRTYSGILFIPRFYSDGLLFLRGGGLYRWNPPSDTEGLLIEQFIDISISPDGRYAATYAINPTLSSPIELRLWDLESAPAKKLYEHIFPAMDAWHSVAFSTDGQQIATGGSNFNVRLWDFSTGADTVTFTETNRPGEFGEAGVIDLAYSADGRFVAGCINTIANKFDGIMVDTKNATTVATIGGYSSANQSLCGSVSFNAADQTVWFGGADGSLRVWSIDTLMRLRDTTIDTAERMLTGHSDAVVSIAISPDGKQMATASWDKTVKLWDYASGQVIHTFDAHVAPVYGVAFSPDGKTLVTSGEDGTVRVWDLTTYDGTILARVEGKRENQSPYPLVTDLEFSPDGSVLAGSEYNGQIHLWDMAQRREVALFQADDSVWHIAFNKVGTLLATASTAGTVRLWGIPAA